jgi:hypothetical protein
MTEPTTTTEFQTTFGFTWFDTCETHPDFNGDIQLAFQLETDTREDREAA